MVDPAGRVVMSVTGKTEHHSGAAAALVIALRERKPVFTDLHAEAQDPAPHISVVAPVFTGDGRSRASTRRDRPGQRCRAVPLSPDPVLAHAQPDRRDPAGPARRRRGAVSSTTCATGRTPR